MALPAFSDPVVRTEVYDGPLDLLLQLVQRDGVDLFHLPLVEITREYLAALAHMQVVDLDLAGEFLVMAATLCELKSRELLPGPVLAEAEEGEVDPKELLIRRILLHQRYRNAAEELFRGDLLDRDTFTRPDVPVDDRARPVEPGIDAVELCELYSRSLARRDRPPPVHEIEREPLHWRAALLGVLEALDDGQEHSLDELLAQHAPLPPRILTFLGVLELCRLGAVTVHQREHLSPILLRGLLPPGDAALDHIPEDL
ncbi:MAG: segregation/condensation protein A [Pseudomonadota bacterium]